MSTYYCITRTQGDIVNVLEINPCHKSTQGAKSLAACKREVISRLKQQIAQLKDRIAEVKAQTS